MQVNRMGMSGAVVLWKLGDTSRDDLSALDMCGMGDFIPDQRTPQSVLKQTLTEIYGNATTLVRPLEADRSFEVVSEIRGETKNEYLSQLTASVTEDGYVTADIEQRKLQDRFNELSRLLPGPTVSAAMVGIVQKLGGIALRPTGAVYWLPSSKLPIWAAITQIVEAAAPDRDSQVYAMQTACDGETLRAVRDGIATDITDAVGKMTTEIIGGDLGERALESRKTTLAGMMDKLAEYESIVGETLVALRTKLSETSLLAAQAAILASAKQEAASAA